MMSSKPVIIFTFLLAVSIFHVDTLKADSSAMEGKKCGRHDFLVHTVDGVPVRGSLYNKGNDRVIIYCHRLLGDGGGGEVDEFLEMFSDEYDLITFSFRGHKSSFGMSTTGGEEILDLRAVVSFARSRGYGKTVVIGAGMGGTVGARAAAIFRNIDALVVISPSGFSPDLAPFFMRIVSDNTLGTPFGKVPLRIIAKTRLGLRYSAGFPVDIMQPAVPIPVLIVQSENDRFVKLKKMKLVFDDIFKPGELVVIPGGRHAEDLLDDNTLARVRGFLDEVIAETDHIEKSSIEKKHIKTIPDTARIEITGDLPIPERMIIDELHKRLSARTTATGKNEYRPGDVLHMLEDVLSFRGYTRVSATLVDSFPSPCINIAIPMINSVSIRGNRWVRENYIRDILRIGGDYYNEYELDAAIRRLSSEPSIKTVKPRIIECDDGNVDIRLTVVEKSPYGFLLSTKFTDIDKFFGIGFKWNEFNPTGLQYEGRAMLGVKKYDFLNYHRVSKNFLGTALRLNAAYFDIIKSRDDLDYIFSRQEVHEIGGEFSVRYRLFPKTVLRVGIFGKRYKSPEVSLDLPVAEGTAGGANLKLDVSGRFPFRRTPRFNWSHTFFYQKTGPRGVGDFFFDTYQFNFSCELMLFRHHKVKTTFHGGWISGKAPPQEHFSLGGMTTLPGYQDDSFMDTRMALFGQAVYLSAGSLVDETSVWHPLRLILCFNAGTVWGSGDRFRTDALRMDVGFELDYMEVLRAGITWPVGSLREGSPRVYIGWGVHVF